MTLFPPRQMIGGYDPLHPKFDNLPDWAKDWWRTHNGAPVSGKYPVLQKKDDQNFKIHLGQWDYLQNVTVVNHKSMIAKWNEWRKAHFDEEIWLCGAGLEWAYLKGVNLKKAHLEKGNLGHAHLEKAKLVVAHLEDADLRKAYLKKASLRGAHLEGARIWGSRLEGANLRGARLTKARMFRIHYDTATNCMSSNLDEALMHPADYQALQYNIRRRGWKRWRDGFGNYGKKKVARWYSWPFRQGTYMFWWISDFGISTKRIVGIFFLLSLIFAFFYWCFPGMLYMDSQIGEPLAGWDFLHKLYFSVVTMTTLGSGDVHANPASPPGQIILLIQVILGYVLLGALVTRLGIIFSGSGPVERPKLSPEDRELLR